MRKLKVDIIGLLVLLMISVGIAAVIALIARSNATASSDANTLSAAVTTQHTPVLHPTPVVGPSGEMVPPTTRIPAPGLPAIPAPVTEQAVRDYVEAHGRHGFGRVRTSVPATVVSIELLTERDLQARLHTSPGWPDETKLFYLVLSGSFTHPGPVGAVSDVYPRAVVVFHAETGNSLLVTVRND